MKLFAVGLPGKKASLNLSINAIVVLILAIVMLGLGLAFIRNVFGGATEKIKSGLENVDIRTPASSDNPITIADVTMKRTAETRVEVGVYNGDVTPKSNIKLQISECTDSQGNAIANNPIIAAPPHPSLQPSVGTGFRAIFSWEDASNRAPPTGTYVCTIEALEGTTSFETAQFYVQLVS
ncbi:hypothetical protein HYS47_02220 [Candidatus Woesearchaeota archaeon]|nr:hypothetical protein [Candidatus Woesearchaeota archaeon]